MSSIALYNKYRSRTFAEPDDHPLVGQAHVTRTLRNAVASGQIAHAYLFCGPRGTGKTSAARILARAVNCRRGLRGEPCNECENCRALLSGRQLDLLIEIDGDSNRGVDDVRALRERILQRPGGAELTGRYKVYIIDEVHMLTTEAFNALLKSLEEPPPYVIFVLATTDPQKVPATVASRCQRFDFKPIPLETLVAHMAHIAEAEHVTVEPAAIELLARAAAGGARDAVSLLDQALAYAGVADAESAPGATRGHLTAAQVQAMLGVTDAEAVARLVDALIARDLPAALRDVQEVAVQGNDLRQFTRQVLEFLRALLLTQSQAADLLHLDEETQLAVNQRASRLPLADLLRIIRLFGQAEQGLKSPSAQPQLPLELAIVEALVAPAAPAAPPAAVAVPVVSAPAPASVRTTSAVGRPPTPPAAAQPPAAAVPVQPEVAPRHGLEVPPDGAPQPEVPPAESPTVAAALAPAGSWPARESTPEAFGPASPPESPPMEPPPSIVDPTPSATWGDPEARTEESQTMGTGSASAPAGASAITLDQVKGRWPAVLDDLRRSNHRTLEALLRSGAPMAVEPGNVVVLGFRYSFHSAKVQEVSNQIAVEKAIGRVLNVACKVRCVVEETSDARAERAQPAQSAPHDPVVAKALRIWRARILEPAERAALEALPTISVTAVLDLKE